MEHAIGLLSQLGDLSTLPPALRREVNAVVHKMTYPMTNILAKVPGDNLAQRAKRLKVSRQTMYVWMSEKYRPTLVQAKRIAKFTDVPVEHIIDDGFEDADTRKQARKEAARLAANRKATKARSGRTAPRRRRAIADKHRVGKA